MIRTVNDICYEMLMNRNHTTLLNNPQKIKIELGTWEKTKVKNDYKIISVIIVSISIIFMTSITPAYAVFHFWDINEIFSNEDGTIQFIEMSNGVFGQNQQQGQTFTTGSGNVFTFPNNLPSSNTAGRTFLIATQDFKDQTGNPTPDFIIPSNFFNTNGDILNYADADRFTFADGDLPLDGIRSLNDDRTIDVASPTNFAGDTVDPVPDQDPPVLTLPADITVDNDPGQAGAIVTFTATADDNVDGPITPVCIPASGSFFSLGDTTVDCTATDTAGNSASGSFTITVNDAEPPADQDPPVLTLPADITVDNDPGQAGAIVTFTATADDNVDGPITPVCIPASGSFFSLGDTTVDCTATDTAGNSASGSFTITVNDAEPPVPDPASKSFRAKFVGKHADNSFKSTGTYKIDDERFRKIIGMGTYKVSDDGNGDRCKPFAATETLDFGNGNTLDLDISGELCKKRFYERLTGTFDFDGGTGDFEFANGGGDISATITKRYFIARLDGTITSEPPAPKQISLRDIGILQIATHDLVDVDRATGINREDGKLNLSTLFNHGDENIPFNGEIRNRSNLIIFNVGQEFVQFFFDLKDNQGMSKDEAIKKTVEKFHEEFALTFERTFDEPLPEPRGGAVTHTENLAYRTLHDLIPGRIMLGGIEVNAFEQNPTTPLTEEELMQLSAKLDGTYDPELFTIRIPFPPFVIDLFERDSTFATDLGTDFSLEFFLEELKDGSYDKTDEVMKQIRSLISKGLNV